MEEDEELHLALEMSMATNKKEEKDTRFPEFWTNLSEKQAIPILLYLSVRDLLNLRLTCKRFVELISESFWVKVYFAEWNIEPVIEQTSQYSNDANSNDIRSQLAAYRMKHQKIHQQHIIHFQHYMKTGVHGFCYIFSRSNIPISIQLASFGNQIIGFHSNIPDKYFLLAFNSGIIRKYNALTLEPMAEWKFENISPSSVSFCFNSIVFSQEKSLTLFEMLDNGKLELKAEFLISINNPNISKVVLTSQLIIVQALKFLSVFNRSNKQLIASLTTDTFAARDNLLLVVDSTRTLLIVFEENGQRRDTILPAYKDIVLNDKHNTCLVCDFRDYLIAAVFSTSPHVVVLWNMMTNFPHIIHLNHNPFSIKCIKIMPSLDYILCYQIDGSMFLINTFSNKITLINEFVGGCPNFFTFFSNNLLLVHPQKIYNIKFFDKEGFNSQISKVTQVYQSNNPDELNTLTEADVFLYFKQKVDVLKVQHQDNFFDQVQQFQKEERVIRPKLNEKNLKIPIFLKKAVTEAENLLNYRDRLSQWSSSLISSAETLSFDSALTSLMEGSVLEKNLSPKYIPIFSQSLSEVISPLQQRVRFLIREHIDQANQQLNALLPVTQENYEEIRSIRGSLTKKNALNTPGPVSQWFNETTESDMYKEVIKRIESELATFNVDSLLNELQALRILVTSESSNFDEFWKKWNSWESRYRSLENSFQFAPSNKVLQLIHEKDTLFRETCKNHMTYFQSQVLNARKQLSSEDFNVSKAQDILDQLKELEENPLFRTLSRFNEQYFLNVIETIQLTKKEIEIRLKELKDVEELCIASVMEQIDQLSSGNSSLSSQELLDKLAGFRQVLDKYTESNSDWVEIGKNRIKQLELDLLGVKSKSEPANIHEEFLMDLEDMRSDDEEEEEEEGEDGEEEEEEND